MVTPTLLQVPNSDEMSEGALPLHQSPLGSSVQVGLSRVTPEAADPVPSQGWVAVGGGPEGEGRTPPRRTCVLS